MKPRLINTALLLCTAGGVESIDPFRLFRQSQTQKMARIRKRDEMIDIQNNVNAPEGVNVNVDVSWGPNNNWGWGANNNNNWGWGANNYNNWDCYTKASKAKSKSAKTKSGKSKAGKTKSSKCSGPPPPPSPPTVEPVPIVTPDPTRRPTMRPVEDVEPTFTPTILPTAFKGCSGFNDRGPILKPNPYTFEPPFNVFPAPPRWKTKGDGVWAIDSSSAHTGQYSIKSPNFDGEPTKQISNATLEICVPEGQAGPLTFYAKASVLPPQDVFIVYVDGVLAAQLVDVQTFEQVRLELEPGDHRVDFSYQYNIFNLDPDSTEFENIPNKILGAVWLDDISFGFEPVPPETSDPPTLSPSKLVTTSSPSSPASQPPTSSHKPSSEIFPSFSPTVTATPTTVPSLVPSEIVTVSLKPTTAAPSPLLSQVPSQVSFVNVTDNPTTFVNATGNPTTFVNATDNPTIQPTLVPTLAPNPAFQPDPTQEPTQESNLEDPTLSPTLGPTTDSGQTPKPINPISPTISPTLSPTLTPTQNPSTSIGMPSVSPAPSKSSSPTKSASPTKSSEPTKSSSPTKSHSPTISSAPSTSCAPFSVNPWTFEPPNNIFPKAPWTNGICRNFNTPGFPIVPCDGNWAIAFDQKDPPTGSFSLKSPKLDSLGTGNTKTFRGSAQLRLCKDFGGGRLRFKAFPGAVRPFDRLLVVVDGIIVTQLRDAGKVGEEWIFVPNADGLLLSKGPHQIEFQYEYNPFNTDLATRPTNPNRVGAVWIDTVEFF